MIDAVLSSLRASLEKALGGGFSLYLYGSAARGDYRPPWSDIDVLALTEAPLTREQAEGLLCLRQTLGQGEPGLPFRALEGGILPADAFLNGEAALCVYWGTSGERLTEGYALNSLSRLDLLNHGRLLCGREMRAYLARPSFDELRADVRRHYESIRAYAGRTAPGYYAYGWLLDIARGLYTLKTGGILPKTEAGKWALERGLCPEGEARAVLKAALRLREDPSLLQKEPEFLREAEKLNGPIQAFADVLEEALQESGG